MYKINPVLQGYILKRAKSGPKVPAIRQTRNDPGMPKSIPDDGEVLQNEPVPLNEDVKPTHED